MNMHYTAIWVSQNSMHSSSDLCGQLILFSDCTSKVDDRITARCQFRAHKQMEQGGTYSGNTLMTLPPSRL